MAYGDKQNYSEDMFADTRMSFGEHLEDLRLHLWRAFAGFLLAFLFSLLIGRPVLQFIARPVEEQLSRFYDQRVENVRTALEENDAAMQAVDEPREVTLSFRRQQLMDALGVKEPAAAAA